MNDKRLQSYAGTIAEIIRDMRSEATRPETREALRAMAAQFCIAAVAFNSDFAGGDFLGDCGIINSLEQQS